MAKENNFDKIVPHDIFISGDLKVLICYMLTSLNEAVPITETAQLFHYEGIANYFDTQTAIYELEKEGYIVRKENNTDMIFVTEKGTFLSDTLKDSVSLILRDKVYTAVVKMLTRYKAERDTDIEITKEKSGYFLTYKVLGDEEPVLSFSLMLPNMSQATALKEQIIKNPKYYCDSLINLLTENIQLEEKSEG